MIVGWGIPCKSALRWMSLALIDDKSTLVQVMAWCRQATSHYLNQCWPRYLSSYGVTRPQWVNSLAPGGGECHHMISLGLNELKPEHNGCCTADILNCIFLTDQFGFLILKCGSLLRLIPKDDKNIPICHSKCHGCWWPGDTRHDTDPVFFSE